jgi:N-acetyl-gamma-glutamyl-phosphate reductase
MTRVHVWGASGYAAAEAIRLLDAHPFAEVGVLESRSHAGDRLADHFPLLRKSEYTFEGPGKVLSAVRTGDVVITAGGHGEARSIVPELLGAGARVIDLSADFRLDDVAVYGLSEWRADEISRAILVANPGCYPTASLLAVLPLAGLGRITQVIVDAKSGVTGAGRNPSVGALYAEVSGDIRAYGLGGHRHHPEIETNLHAGGIDAPLMFTPHVVPIARGMLADAYVIFEGQVDALEVEDAFERAYSRSPFVRVLEDDAVPSVAAVNGTNDVELRFDVQGPVVRVLGAIDNLGKGAAGQAVQNLNLMLGYPEESGLDARAIIA